MRCATKGAFRSRFASFDGCMRRKKWVALIVEDKKGKDYDESRVEQIGVFLSIFMRIDDSIVTVHKRERERERERE
jgi:hypothetical protein